MVLTMGTADGRRPTPTRENEDVKNEGQQRNAQGGKATGNKWRVVAEEQGLRVLQASSHRQ
jgi:hypothetical protein